MTYRGHYRNGVIVLDEPVELPEGAEVQIVSEERRSLAERLKDIVGIAPDLPEDMSLNHDHYLHGMPKK